jgi:hypothetical protein
MRECSLHVLYLVSILFILVIINLEFYLFNAGGQASLYMCMGVVGVGGQCFILLGGLKRTSVIPCYVPNTILRRDLHVPSFKQEVRDHSTTYRQWLNHHPDRLATSLFHGPTIPRRLKRYQPADLPTRL